MGTRIQRVVANVILLCWVASLIATTGLARAESPRPPIYDRIDASSESYRRAEANRRETIGLQLDAVDAMAWRAGAFTYSPYPPDMETAYAYGPPRAYRSGAERSPVTVYRSYSGVFEPWPVVPGDIYGYPYVERIEQPSGHTVVPYGPNGYYYGPVYAHPWGDHACPRMTPLNPPVSVQPPAPATAGESPPAPPGPEPIPAPPATEDGPREF